MKLLMLGATGLLGSTLQPFLAAKDYDLRTLSRNKDAGNRADLTDRAAIFELLDRIEPGTILNLVGLTDVDRCETHPNEAYLINVRTVENIAAWIEGRKQPCHLVHISTDQVYDSEDVHSEESVTLTNYYAFSKYAGELAALRVPSTILRTNFVGRSHCEGRVSLTDWFFKSLVNQTPIQVFDDVRFSPLSMSTLAQMIHLSIQKQPKGVFNLGSHEGMSKAEFAFAFAKALGLSTAAVTRTTTDKVTFLKAYRPRDMRMDSTRFEHALALKLPSLREEISRLAEEYNDNK